MYVLSVENMWSVCRKIKTFCPLTLLTQNAAEVCWTKTTRNLIILWQGCDGRVIRLHLTHATYAMHRTQLTQRLFLSLRFG